MSSIIAITSRLVRRMLDCGKRTGSTRLIAVALLTIGGITRASEPVADSIDQHARPCASCHGAEGRATNDGFYPRIAGKPAEYLYNQLLNFRSYRRDNAAMSYMVERQRVDFLHELAEYFARQDLPYPPPPKLAASGEMLSRGRVLALEGDTPLALPACRSCHGERLTGALPTIPGLLGLPYSYVISQLRSWSRLTRRAAEPDCMATISTRLDEDDLSAVAVWLATQPVPTDSRPDATVHRPLPMACGSVSAGP